MYIHGAAGFSESRSPLKKKVTLRGRESIAGSCINLRSKNTSHIIRECGVPAVATEGRTVVMPRRV